MEVEYTLGTAVGELPRTNDGNIDPTVLYSLANEILDEYAYPAQFVSWLLFEYNLFTPEYLDSIHPESTIFDVLDQEEEELDNLYRNWREQQVAMEID